MSNYYYDYFDKTIPVDEAEDFEDMFPLLDQYLQEGNEVSNEEVERAKFVTRSLTFLFAGFLIIPDENEFKDFVKHIVSSIKDETGFSKYVRVRLQESNSITEKEVLAAIDKFLNPLLLEGRMDIKAKGEATRESLRIYYERKKMALEELNKIK